MTPLGLFERNKGLAYSATNEFCRRFPRVRQDRDILENYALTGLWVAATKFDQTHGCEFAKFASGCIELELLNGRSELDDCGIRLHPRRQVRKGQGPPVAITGRDWDSLVDLRHRSEASHLEAYKERLPFLDDGEVSLVYGLLADGTPLGQLAKDEHGGICWRLVSQVVAALATIKAHYPNFLFKPKGFYAAVLRAARTWVVEKLAQGPLPRRSVLGAVRQLFHLEGTAAWWYTLFVRRCRLCTEWLPWPSSEKSVLCWRLLRPGERQDAKPSKALETLPCET